MKTPKLLKQLAILASLALAAVAPNAHAQGSGYSNYVVIPFDTDTVTGIWANWFGGAFTSATWDSTVNQPANPVATNPVSGSMKVISTWSAGVGDQIMLWNTGGEFAPPINGLFLTNFQCDVYIDPGSVINPSGQYPDLRFGSRGTGFGQPMFGFEQYTQAQSGQWLHVSLPVNALTQPAWTTIPDILIQEDTFNVAGMATSGTVTMWFDNMQLDGVTSLPIPPPVLAIQPAKPGLRMFSSTASATYEEEGIASVDSFQGWIGQLPGQHPAYSVTMDWGNTLPGFVFQLDIVPRNWNGQAFNSPYQAYFGTNICLWTIQNNGTNFVSTMWWKTNGYAVGAYTNVIPIVTNIVGNGTWTLTWLDDSNGTVTPPGGSPAPFSLPADPNGIVSFMGDPNTLVFCITPNTTANFGKYINIQSIYVTNVAGASQDDDFTKDYGLNALLWDPGFSVNGPAAIQQVPPSSTYWVNWNVPDGPYSTNLETAPLITTAPANWYSPGYYANSNAVTTVLESNRKWTLLSTSNAVTSNLLIGGPKSATAFFRLSTNAPVQ